MAEAWGHESEEWGDEWNSKRWTMDGRKKLGVLFFAAGVLALANTLTFAQAMGKAAVDTHTVTTPLALNFTQSPSKPTPSAPSTPVVETPKHVEKKPEVIEKKPDPADETPVVTTQPAPETPKSTRPLTSIEQQPIRARTQPEDAATTQGATAVTNGSSGMYGGFIQVLQVAGALVAVIGLIFILKALARKFVPGAAVSNGKGVIEILARHPLSKTQSLVLVRIGSQIVALNQGKDQSQSVLVISEPVEVARLMGQIEGANPDSISAGFDNMLATARRDLEEPHDEADESPLATTPGVGANRAMAVEEDFEEQMDEMAAAKRQLMDLRNQVRAVRERLPLK